MRNGKVFCFVFLDPFLGDNSHVYLNVQVKERVQLLVG